MANITMAKELDDKIVALAKAERITKKLLGELSRELLAHHLDCGDVSLINKLLGSTKTTKQGKEEFTLTPINFRFAVQYFRSFIPHASNWEDVKDYCLNGTGKREAFEFLKASKNAKKRIIGNHEGCDSVEDVITEWLADEANDIWSWSDGVKVQEVEKDYAAMITKAVEKGLDEDKGGLSVTDVTMAIMEAGVTGADLIQALEDVRQMVLNGQQNAA